MSKYSTPIVPKYFKDTTTPRKAVSSLLQKAQSKSKSKTQSANVVPESATPVFDENYDPKVAKETNDRLWREMNERRAKDLPIEGLTYLPQMSSGRMVRTGQASERRDVLGNRMNRQLSTSVFRPNTEQEFNNIQQLMEEQARLADSIKPTQSYSERKKAEKRIEQIENILSASSDDFAPSQKYKVVQNPSREYSASTYPKRSEVARFIAPRRMLQAQRSGQDARGTDIAGVSSFSFATVKPVSSGSSVPSEKAYLPSIEEMRAEKTKLEQQLKTMQDEAEKFRSTDFASMDIDDDPFSEAERLSDRIDAMRGKINTVQRRIKDAESNPWYAQTLGTGKGRTLTVESQPYARVYRSPREQGLQEPPRQDIQEKPPSSSAKPIVVNKKYVSEALQQYNTHKSQIKSIEDEIDKLLEQDSPDVDKKVSDLLYERDLSRGRLNASLHTIDEIRKNKDLIADSKLRRQVEAISEKPVNVKPVGTPTRRANTPIVPSGARPTQSAQPAQNTQPTAQVRSPSRVNAPSSRQIPSIVQGEINAARRASASGSLSDLDRDFENWLKTQPSTSSSTTGSSSSGRASKPSSATASNTRKRPSSTEVERNLKTKSYRSASYLNNRELGMLYLRPELRSVFFDKNPHLVSQFESEIQSLPQGTRQNRMRAIVSGAYTPVTRVLSTTATPSSSVRPRKQVSSTVSSPSFSSRSSPRSDIPASMTPAEYRDRLLREKDIQRRRLNRNYRESTAMRIAEINDELTRLSPILNPSAPLTVPSGAKVVEVSKPETKKSPTISVSSPETNKYRMEAPMTTDFNEFDPSYLRSKSTSGKRESFDDLDPRYLRSGSKLPKSEAIRRFNALINQGNATDYDAVLQQAQKRKNLQQQLMLESLLFRTPQEFQEMYGGGKFNPRGKQNTRQTETKKPTQTSRIRTTITPETPSTPKKVVSEVMEVRAPSPSAPSSASAKTQRTMRRVPKYNQTKQQQRRLNAIKPSGMYELPEESKQSIEELKGKKVKDILASAPDDFVEIRPTSGAFTNVADVKRTWKDRVLGPLRSMKNPRQGKANAVLATAEGVKETADTAMRTPIVRAVTWPVRRFNRMSRAGKIATLGALTLGGVKLFDMAAGLLPRKKDSNDTSSSAKNKEYDNVSGAFNDFGKRSKKRVAKSAYSNTMMKTNKKIKKSMTTPHASKKVNQNQIEHYTSNGVKISNKYF